jgi:hypothetical protein
MHPETKTPMTATLESGGPSDNLASWYSGTVAFLEPDPTGKRITRAWVTTNIFPKSSGPIEGKRDLTSALAIKEVSQDFTALSFYNEGTRQLGQELLDAITLDWANPQIRSSFIKEVSADVAAVEQGYKQSAEIIAKERVGDLI